jgi:hypothetical protein
MPTDNLRLYENSRGGQYQSASTNVSSSLWTAAVPFIRPIAFAGFWLPENSQDVTHGTGSHFTWKA